jgi:N-methylhydantoinase A
MPPRSQPLRIAIDTGGTFTDCVWIDPVSGQLRMLKVFSTPSDPSQAIAEAVAKIALNSDLVILHGTTVGTNSLLERKGARTALVTTAGFEDTIEIGRQARPKLYNFFFERIAPLVPADLRFGIDERVSSTGEIIVSPAPSNLQALVAKISASRPESIAISFLFSFANPANELAVAQALTQLHIPLSISHQILPEFREYERTSTVVINAYLQPVMQRYLENLERRTATPAKSTQDASAIERNSVGERTSGAAHNSATERDSAAQRISATAGISVEERRFSAAKSANYKTRALAPAQTHPRFFVMQSSGGITSLASAAREPVRTILSGPAGGVVGGAAVAHRSGFDRIIAFDMGGTSTDVSLVEGAITTASHAEIAGLPIGVPMLDIHTVGAGGGSLARFDVAGVLRVGPESAGADPGPICYGRGTQPTVTDANLLLGRLRPTQFLGGDFTLDLDRTRRVTGEWLRQQKSSLTLEQFAEGVIRVVNATMEKAIRVVSIERGRDPRDYALVAFGGAGGLHACALAEALRIPHVIIPALPGALSAFGILVSDVVKDYSRTILLSCGGKLPQPRLIAEFAALEKQAEQDFHRESWPGRIHHLRSVDLRYRGQGYELHIPFTKNMLADFHKEYARRYGYAHPDREVELVTLRLRSLVKTSSKNLREACPERAQRAEPVRPSRAKLGRVAAQKDQIQFNGKKLPATIHSRDQLILGKKYSGPAIVTEYSATTVIPPGKTFHLDRAQNLIVKIP